MGSGCYLTCLGDLEETLEALREGDFSYYSGVRNHEDIGYELVEEGLFGDVPENIKSYLDYESIGREWDCNGGILFLDLEIVLVMY